MQQLQRRVLVLGIIGFIMAPIQWTASQVVKGASSVETGALKVWQWCDNKRTDRELKKEYNLRFKYKKSMGESVDERQGQSR